MNVAYPVCPAVQCTLLNVVGALFLLDFRPLLRASAPVSLHAPCELVQLADFIVS